MKRLQLIILTSLLPAVLLCLDYVPKQMIVKTSAPKEIDRNSFGIQDFDDFLVNKQVTNIKEVFRKDDNQYFVVSVDERLNWDEISDYEFDGIDYVQPNYINELFVIPNDPEFENQQFDMINVPEAWNYTTGNKEIIIGLIDSGVLIDHPDLQTNIMVNQGEIPSGLLELVDTNEDGYVSLVETIAHIPWDLNQDSLINYLDVIHPNSPFTNGSDDDENGYADDIVGWDFVDAPDLADIALGDYYDQDNDPHDENNHGTHVAGIMVADSNNNQGVCGICWNTKLLVIRSGFRTVDGAGYLQDDDAAAGIIYAVDMGADVLNLSWGDTEFSQIIADACYYAHEKGTIVVVAAGNTGEAEIMYPARLSTTISVGSVDKYLELASFSSYGPNLDVVAPGQFVMSTYDTESVLYKELSGTSVSSPFVAGSVALLLSMDPQLTYEQVRAKLSYSALDLGSSGFDNHFGNGLLDVYALVTNDDDALIEITSPADNTGISDDFDIIGTVTASEFWKYSVMYTTETMPDSDTDWYNVSADHSNVPIWYENEVENGLIAPFIISDLFPDDTYQIKIELLTKRGGHYDYRQTIHIDQSVPVLYDSLSATMKRYDAELPSYYIQAVFDEPVNLTVICNGSGEPVETQSNYADSVQMIRIPDEIPEGTYSIDLHATNISGLASYLEFPYDINIERNTVDVNKYEQTTAGPEVFAIRRYLDVDGDGKNEFLALQRQEEADTVKFYEVAWNQNQGYYLDTQYNYSNSVKFWPHDIGIANPNGYANTLGVKTDTTLVLEANIVIPYPMAEINWHPVNFYGGNFLDFDEYGLQNDGIEEIGLVKNTTIKESVGGSTVAVSKRVITLNKRHGNSFGIGSNHEPDYYLFNDTPTNLKNQFVNRIVSGNLDNDEFPDILSADTDGDIMIFEINPDSIYYYHDIDSIRTVNMVWWDRLPVPNAYYLATGNFTNDGDGIDEFCVGGFTLNLIDQAKSFSYLKFFEYAGEDNQYNPVGYLSFDQLSSNNSIANADLDGDGDDEIVVALPPNVYVIDYVNGEYIPIWKGLSTETFHNSIVAIPQTDSENSAIVVNVLDGGEVRSSIITARNQSELTGPPTPEGYRIKPINESLVQLKWNQSDEADSCNIYVKLDGQVHLAGTTTENEYLDTFFFTLPDFTLGDTLYYNVTSLNSSYSPNESLPTLWKPAIPNPIPILQSISMVSDYELQVLFDHELANDALNIGNFASTIIDSLTGSTEIDSIGTPTSVNFVQGKKGLLVRFGKPIPQLPEQDFQRFCILSIHGVKGATGVLIAEGDYYYNYSEDTISPSILVAEAISEMIVKLSFTEAIDSVMAEDLNNYFLIPPVIDANNTIQSISYFHDETETFVHLNMTVNLKYSNQPYFLKISNIEDMAGNSISNSGNKCLFSRTNISNLDHMVVYPNPMNLQTEIQQRINFINLPLEEAGHIRIYDIAGDLVYKQDFGPFHNPVEYLSWNLANEAGKRVSSGMYFYVIKVSKHLKKGEIVIIN